MTKMLMMRICTKQKDAKHLADKFTNAHTHQFICRWKYKIRKKYIKYNSFWLLKTISCCFLYFKSFSHIWELKYPCSVVAWYTHIHANIHFIIHAHDRHVGEDTDKGCFVISNILLINSNKTWELSEQINENRSRGKMYTYKNSLLLFLYEQF